MPSYFTSYQFPATDAPTSRTLPDRITEVFFNVTDYGAKGDGSGDDAPAINAAIAAAYAILWNATWQLYGGVVFFPPGIYRVTSTINLGLNINQQDGSGNKWSLTFRGGGRDATTIVGDLAGTAVVYFGTPTAMVNDVTMEVPDPDYTHEQFNMIVRLQNLTIKNENTAAWSRAVWLKNWGSSLLMSNVRAIAMVAFGSHYNAFHCIARDLIAQCISPVNPANGTSHGPPSGSVGFHLIGGEFTNCQAIGFDCGFSIVQLGSLYAGCVATQCNIGFDHGGHFLPNTSPGAKAIIIVGNVADRCEIGFRWSAIGGADNEGHLAAGNVCIGTEGVAISASISDMVWSASPNTVTVTTALPHNLPASQTLIQLFGISPTGFIPAGSGALDGSGNGFVTVTKTGSNTFTYTGPNSDPGSFVSGAWNYPLKYGIQVQCAEQAAFSANVLDKMVVPSPPNGGSVGFLDSGTIVYTTFYATTGPSGWHLLDGANVRMGSCNFVMCGIAGKNPPVGFLKFAGLPTTGNTERSIVDARTQTTFGGTIAAGGSSNHYKVRYDGANWIRVA